MANGNSVMIEYNASLQAMSSEVLQEVVHDNVHDNVYESLLKHPETVDFYQLVQLLEKTESYPHGDSGSDTPRNFGVRSTIQIRPNVSLSHPTSDISQLECTGCDPFRYRLTVNFFGLYGVESPLPDYYAEEFLVAEEAQGFSNAETLDDDLYKADLNRQFLDVFHQRLYWLLFDAKQKYRYPAHFRQDTTDTYSKSLSALIGHAKVSAFGLDSLRFMDLFARRNRSGHHIQLLLQSQLCVPLRLEQCVYQRVNIPVKQRIALGQVNSQLGDNMSIGGSVGDRTGKIRLYIGPLDWSTFHELQPGGHLFSTLCQLLKTVLSNPLAVELILLLQDQSRYPLTLASASVQSDSNTVDSTGFELTHGHSTQLEARGLLGQSSWLGNTNGPQSVSITISRHHLLNC